MCKKVPAPLPMRYSTPPPPLKISETTSPWNYNSSKFISTLPPPNFREGAHLSLYTSQNMQAAECHEKISYQSN